MGVRLIRMKNVFFYNSNIPLSISKISLSEVQSFFDKEIKLLFILKGKIIWAIALPMAASNALGGWIGAKLAINKGNSFIRIFFLIVVIGTLIRFSYDVFYK